MSPSDHPDFDALSAYVDGEAPEWAEHVPGCEACRAGAAELRAVAAAVGGQVDPPAPAVREAAIAAALDAMPARVAPLAGAPSRLAPDRHDAEPARFARRGAPRPWALPAVAAVVLAMLGLSGVVLSSYRSSDHLTQTAGGALESGAKAGAGLAGAPQAPIGDLGDVPDAATLRARAQVGVPTALSSSTGRSASSSNSGAAADSSGQSAVGAPNATSGNSGSAVSPATGSGGAANTTGASGAPVSTGAASGGAGGQASATNPGATGGSFVVGTRPCEEQARTREPSLGLVVYFATARRGTTEGYVLGFTPVGSNAPVTLLLLAQDGCRELLRSAGP